MKNLRVGHGFDVHPLVDGRPLIVGGVTIPYEQGLAGHSDGDVLLHAIMDALLGAAGLPDIGQQFPPTDEQYRNAASTHLLRQVIALVRAAGFTEILNIDATIMAEQPQFNPHRAAVQQRIADLLGIAVGQVSIKATTTEQLGFIGRGEGIAASAVCLLAGHD
ncbi:MAG: 2-C-methyl-D-erythritol 2,4-cyclodiphosphate synthase [Candidatus Zixiibacteriota bacterium]